MLQYLDGRDGGGGFDRPMAYILSASRQLVPVDVMAHAYWDIAQRQLHRRGLPNLRVVGWTNIPGYGFVSTQFLGLDHAFGDGPPICFETMSFGPRIRRTKPLVLHGRVVAKRNTGHRHDDVQVRYATWDQAAAGHKAIVKGLRRYWRKMEKARKAGDTFNLRRYARYASEGAWA
jgi:hypothetical protein